MGNNRHVQFRYRPSHLDYNVERVCLAACVCVCLCVEIEHRLKHLPANYVSCQINASVNGAGTPCVSDLRWNYATYLLCFAMQPENIETPASQPTHLQMA